ncbi:hypothetical protein SMD22_07520 [Brevibacillus halotolerans]|nr:hypothetical protein SMD22_07520 [Brevibacillus halotolerans]
MITRLFGTRPRVTDGERVYCTDAFLDYAILIEYRNEFEDLSDEKADRLRNKLEEWHQNLSL